MRAVRVAAGMALVLVAATVTGCTATSVSAASLTNDLPEATAAPVPVAEPTDGSLDLPAATPDAPSVVVIGDSIMDGHGITPEQAWPALVASAYDWRLSNLSSDGTGLVMTGDDGETYTEQEFAAAALAPSVVIVSASSNDIGEDPNDVTDAATTFFDTLRAQLPDTHIIAVSAFWGDTDVPDEMQQIDQEVQGAATAVGADYVDLGQPLAGHPELMQDDDVHPTADGQQQIAASYGPQLEALVAPGR